MVRTPEPWTRGNANDCGEGYAICAGHQVVARVVGFGYPVGKGRSQESDDNAHLLVAAPRMLAALKRNRLMLYAWKAARKNMGLPDNHSELNEAIAAAEAAIAAAEPEGSTEA